VSGKREEHGGGAGHAGAAHAAGGAHAPVAHLLLASAAALGCLACIVGCFVLRPRGLDVWFMDRVRGFLLVVSPGSAHVYSSRNLSSFEIRPTCRAGRFQRVGTAEV